MNTRPILVAARALLCPRSALYNAARASSAYKPPAHWFPPTLNELPVPQGSWQADYDANQKRRNLHLIGGITFFLFTIIYIKASGVIFFNFLPPPLPEDE